MPQIPFLTLSWWRHLYYGWYIAGACNFVAMMTWGVGIFNQGVFLGYFVEQYGWARSTLSIGPTLFHLWGGITGIVVGRLLDQRGPRVVLLLGALTMGGGAVALGLVQQPWHTYPAFFLLGTGFACLHTVTLGKIVARWFLRQRARAMALATFGASLGGTVLVPINAAVMQQWGALAGGITLASITLLVVIPLALWVMKDGPEVVGAAMDGDTNPGVSAEATQASAMDSYPWTVAEAMRTVAFWILAVSFAVGMIAQGGFLVHQVLFLQTTFGLVGAAGVVTITTIAGTMGRISFVLLNRHWAPRHEATIVFILQAIGLALSGLATERWLLILGSAVFGWTMGIIVTLQPLATTQCFGQRAFGSIYGPIYLGIRLGSAFGPLLFGLLATASGSYCPVLLLVSGGLLLAAISVQWVVPPVPRAFASPAV